MSSEIFEGVGLQDDLLKAFEDEKFSFKGTFYHPALQTTAPNPCLQILGLGLVGLPLSERDAKSIISVSNLAPFGRGERKLLGKGVRDTWEIEPSGISFANPQWENYINQTVCAEVCQTLGVTTGNNPPKMELYKLLLYEKNSHFLAHQDTPKVNGTFATVIILLPSAYTGGQVVVSHSSTTKTIDFSANSLLSTALLAWYTDVKHEVKPVTSGYRFALSYNLIQVSSTVAHCLQDMSEFTMELRRVLTKWREDKYADGQNMMAYLLKHQYSIVNLKDGIKGLKGADLHRATFLQPIAEELGFVVGLASLEHNVTGSAYGGGGGCNYGRNRNRWGRRRYDRYLNLYDDYDDDDDGETPAMGKVDSTSTNISGLIDLEGGPLVSLGQIAVDDKCLIPKNPFEDQIPDDEEYDGYTGQIEHWYRRTALVLVHKNKVDDLCYSIEGAPYAIRKLKVSSNPPTSEDRYWATKVFDSRTPLTRDLLLTLMDYSFKWKDLAIWKKVMGNPTWTIAKMEMKHLFKAWEIFSFEGIRVIFEEIVARSTVLSERMTFLSDILAKSPEQDKEAVTAWYKKEAHKILASYSSSNAQDSASILVFIKYAGLNSFRDVMMPNLLKISDNYVFMISLIKMFEDNHKAIIEQEIQRRSLELAAMTSDHTTVSLPQMNPAAAQPNPDQIVTDLVKQCLQAAALQWSSVPSYPIYLYYDHPNANAASSGKVDRIITILDKAISLSEINICRTLVIDILKATGSASDKFAQLYNPLIPRLRTLLASKGLTITTPPFVNFLQIIIGVYMRDVLGKKGNVPNIKVRQIGCGCSDCKELDKFILNPTLTSHTFRVVQARRLHLERHCAAARDVCTYVMIKSGSPHAIQVTKLPEFVQASTWPYKQNSAKAFLNTIGDDAVIAKIMGSRYADVNNAILGSVPFGGETPRMHTLVPTAGSLNSSASSSRTAAVPQATNAGIPVSTSVQPQAGASIAGQKRKSGPFV